MADHLTWQDIESFEGTNKYCRWQSFQDAGYGLANLLLSRQREKDVGTSDKRLPNSNITVYSFIPASQEVPQTCGLRYSFC